MLVLICFLAPVVTATSLADYGNVTTYYINITSDMGAQTNYPVRFIISNSSGISGYYPPDNVIYTNGTTRVDWYDINATDNADAPLPFWVENNTQTAYNITAWVNIPSILTDNTSAGKWYFGNPSQSTSTINGLNTFSRFDDFLSTTLNTSQWAIQSSNGNVFANGILTISGSTAGARYGIIDTSAYGENYSVVTRTDFNTDLLSGSTYLGWETSNATNPGVSSNAIEAHAGFFDDANFQNGLGTTSFTWTTEIAKGAGYHVWEANRNGSVARFYVDNAYYAPSAHTNDPSANLKPFVATFVATAGGSHIINSDWVFVRKVVSSEPTTSLYTTSIQYPPVASDFISAPNPSSVGETVQFNDTSTGSPITWNWSFGDGGTSTVRNATNIFATYGTYPVYLNVTNVSGGWSNTTHNQVVVNITGFTPQNIWMQGQYLQTFTLTDADTGIILPNVSITSSSGNSATTGANGTAFLTEPFGAYVLTFLLTGYDGRMISYVFDSDESHAVTLTKSVIPPTAISIPGAPKDVKFHIQSFFGAPIPTANVSVQGISTTTGNWDWLATLLSIDFGETPINGTYMSGLTDSNGDIVFLMMDSIKYNITTTAAGFTFPTTIISPQASQYTISANMNESWFTTGNDTLKEVNVSVSWIQYNATHAFANITYDDQNGMTTGGNITVYLDSPGRMANASAVAAMDITGSSCTNSTLVATPPGGSSYTLTVNPIVNGQRLTWAFTHTFKGQPVTLPRFTSESLLWFALFIMVFTAAFAGVLHSAQISLVICVEAWIFWAIGWLDYLVNWNGYAEPMLLALFTFATFYMVIVNITEGKAKGKRSS